MPNLSEAIQMAKEASVINTEAPAKTFITKKAKILEALTGAGVKTASEEPNELELAKMAAYEMASDALEKLAFAEQLFDEADYVDSVYVKQASDGSDIDLESDGSALDAFLEELESEADE